MVEIQAVILENLSEGVCVIDESNTIIFTNPALDRMFGYEPGELCHRPANVLQSYTEENQARLESAILKVLKHKGFWTGEINGRKKDGSAFITSDRITIGSASGKNFRVHIKVDATALKQSEAARLKLFQKLDSVQEEERYRLSREIHDQLGQDLTALTLGLQSLKKAVTADQEIFTQLECLHEITRQMSQQIHDIATELRPTSLNELGLRIALQGFVERWSARTSIKVDLQVAGLDQHRLATNVETAVYRIVQEALVNVLKHARAQNVIIILNRYADQLILMIADDGQGFDVETTMARAEIEKRLGLLGMRERVVLVGGVLDIESTPGKGVVIALRIPLSL